MKKKLSKEKMIRKSYISYRDCDIEWLGKIPKHWEIKRLKYVCKLNPSKSENKFLPDTFEVTFLPMESIGVGVLNSTQTKKIIDVNQGFTYFANEDLIIAKITPCFENGKGCIVHNLVNNIGFGTTELHVLRVSSVIDNRFLYYLTASFPFRKLGGGEMQGTAGQKRVTGDFIRNFAVPLPPISEQSEIVNYLDQETARIDGLIVKYQRLIELLEEKRASLITRALTKGSDFSADMKETGIPWLGRIPANWQLVHLRRVIAKFVDYRGKTPEKVENGIPLITARNIKNGMIDMELSQEFVKEEDYDEWMVRGLPEPGDVLITMEAPLGETAQIIDTHVALAQRIILLKTEKSLITNEYLKFTFLSRFGQGELWSRATGSTAIGIKASHLREVMVLLPPIDEQIKIVEFIEREKQSIDLVIVKAKSVLKLLNEYRISIISSVVTGKMDVTQ